MHAVIGNGGQSLSGLPAQREPWDVYHANEFGYSTITAHNATHLQVRQQKRIERGGGAGETEKDRERQEIEAEIE